jgi:hypothetical protein
MNWVLTFRLIGVLLALIIAYLTLSGAGTDYIFPCAILMICAGFLSYRFRLKERLDADLAARDED